MDWITIMMLIITNMVILWLSWVCENCIFVVDENLLRWRRFLSLLCRVGAQSLKVVSNSLQPHELWPVRLLCLWDFPGKNTGVGCHFLLQGIFLTQGWNLHLLFGRRILYHWATREAPYYKGLPARSCLGWSLEPFSTESNGYSLIWKIFPVNEYGGVVLCIKDLDLLYPLVYFLLLVSCTLLVCTWWELAGPEEGLGMGDGRGNQEDQQPKSMVTIKLNCEKWIQC